MKKYALIGHPLGHTMSPPIHNRLFELSKIKAQYDILDIAPEKLSEEMDKIFALDGVNVTIPHKISVIPFLSRLDKSAELYGAVNVINCPDKSGYNTDVVGFTRAVNGLGADLCGKTLLLGCGGAGRMMAIETAASGGELTIAVRESDIPAANALAGEISEKANQSARVITIPEISGEYDLLLNATPLGMFPNVDACPVPREVIIKCKCVFDAVYNPRETVLVKTARENGISAGGGMAMLVYQAVAAHEIWDGSKYNESDVKKLISDMSDLLEASAK